MTTGSTGIHSTALLSVLQGKHCLQRGVGTSHLEAGMKFKEETYHISKIRGVWGGLERINRHHLGGRSVSGILLGNEF